MLYKVADLSLALCQLPISQRFIGASIVHYRSLDILRLFIGFGGLLWHFWGSLNNVHQVSEERYTRVGGDIGKVFNSFFSR